MSDMYNFLRRQAFIFAKKMKRLFIFASMAMASGLMLANVYTSLVDARSWGSHLPY